MWLVFSSYNQPCTHFSIDLISLLIFFFINKILDQKIILQLCSYFVWHYGKESLASLFFRNNKKKISTKWNSNNFALIRFTAKPSELPSTPANAPNKVLTTPLRAGTQNETPTSIAPNIKKQKSRLSTQLTSYIQEMNQNREGQLHVAILLLKQLNLLDALSFLQNPQRQVGSLHL